MALDPRPIVKPVRPVGFIFGMGVDAPALGQSIGVNPALLPFFTPGAVLQKPAEWGGCRRKGWMKKKGVPDVPMIIAGSRVGMACETMLWSGRQKAHVFRKTRWRFVVWN